MKVAEKSIETTKFVIKHDRMSLHGNDGEFQQYYIRIRRKLPLDQRNERKNGF